MDEEETPATSTDEMPLATSRTLRLSIFHLMLWMLCTALYLAINRALIEGDADNVLDYRHGLNAFGAVVGGAWITGAFVLVHARWRYGPPLVSHPGHWIVLISGFTLCGYMASAILESPLLLNVDGIWNYNHALILFAAAATFVVSAYDSPEVRWKLLFGIIALENFIQALELVDTGLFTIRFKFAWVGWLMDVNMYWSPFLLCAFFVVAGVRDLVAGKRRDWVHWVGVVTYAVSYGVTAVWMFWALVGPD